MKDLFKKEIMVGVIAAIIMTIFFEPIIRWLWGIISFIGQRTYSGFIDAIYRSAALGHRNYVDVLFFFLVIGIGTAVPIVLRIAQKGYLPRPKKKFGPRYEKVSDIFLFAGLIISASIMMIGIFADLQLNSSFEQRLAVLAPVLSDLEYKQFKAEWAGMENREDFEAINKQMENMAQDRDVELPELLLP